MRKEVIPDRYGICIVIMFLSGTASLGALGIEAKEDIWIANIFAIIISLLIGLIYSKIFSIFPDENLFDIIELCFGKIIGKGIMVVLTFFFFEEAVLVLINFSQFINTVTLNNTPIIIIKIAFIILCVWFVKNGIAVIGQWANTIAIMFIFFIITIVIFLMPYMKIDNIRPFIGGELIGILKIGIITSTWPFGEIIALTMTFSGFKTKQSSYKIYITGLLIGGIISIITSTSNVLVLGVDTASRYYHPTYLSVKKIGVGNLINNIEIVPNIVYTLGAFMKISIFIMATSKGVAKIFNCKEYKFLVIPVGLLMIDYSIFNYEGIADFWEYLDNAWTYTAIVVEIIFPIILYIFFKVKTGRFHTE